jgi:NADH-quinone oxidoreductase subunit J
MQDFLLFLFTILILISALSVVNVKNSVHSALFLLLTYLSGIFLMLLINNEFLAIVLIIIYLGAIIVLFLFVVMLLNLKLLELKQFYLMYIPSTFLFIIIVIYMNTYYFNINLKIFYFFSNVSYLTWLEFFLLYQPFNIYIYGLYLYTFYNFFFFGSRLILTIALLGSLFLTRIIYIKNFFIKLRKHHQDMTIQYFSDYLNVILN